MLTIEDIVAKNKDIPKKDYICTIRVFLLVKIFKDNKKVHKNSEDESLQDPKE